MKAVKNKVVSFHYTLKSKEGELLDSSADGQPMAYIHGLGQIIPGLEAALEGKGPGDLLNIELAPEKAYGHYSEEMIHIVPKSEFQDSAQIELGAQFEVESDQGMMVLTAIEIREDEIVLDGNHPLAGETLCFEIEVSEIREATSEELSHGHVHGPHGEHHH